MRDVAGSDAGLLHERLYGGGNQFHVSLVSHPPGFPVIVELVAVHAEMVDEIRGNGVGVYEPGNPRSVAHHQGCRRVAAEHFES